MQFMIQISTKLYQREMIQTTTWLRSSWLWCWLVTVGFMLVVNVVEVVNSFAIQVSFSRFESRSKEEEVSFKSPIIVAALFQSTLPLKWRIFYVYISTAALKCKSLISSVVFSIILTYIFDKVVLKWRSL